MRVFDVECGGGSGVIVGCSTGTIRASKASKNSWAFNAAFALVSFRPGLAESTAFRRAAFRDGDGDVGPDAAAAARGNNSAHLRHPPFRSDI